MLMLHTPWQIPQCSKECTKYLVTAAFVTGRYIHGICPSVHSVRHLKKCSPAQYSIQFQHCPSYWNACSHATWFFTMGAAILNFVIFGGSHLASMVSHLAKCISSQTTNLSTYLTLWVWNECPEEAAGSILQVENL